MAYINAAGYLVEMLPSIGIFISMPLASFSSALFITYEMEKITVIVMMNFKKCCMELVFRHDSLLVLIC